MMDKIVRVHLMSGEKISVDPLIGQIRPLSLAEVEEVKRNHKSDDIPLWCMIVRNFVISVYCSFFFWPFRQNFKIHIWDIGKTPICGLYFF